jgi:hypothetical protein
MSWFPFNVTKMKNYLKILTNKSNANYYQLHVYCQHYVNP